MKSPKNVHKGKVAHAKNGLAAYAYATRKYNEKHHADGKFHPIPKKGTAGHAEWKKFADEYRHK